jgi:hypothetical protein
MKKSLVILGYTWLVIFGLIIWIAIKLNQSFEPNNLKNQINSHLSQLSNALVVDWKEIDTKYKSNLELDIKDFSVKLKNGKEIFHSSHLNLIFPYKVFLFDTKGRVEAIFENSKLGFNSEEDKQSFNQVWAQFREQRKQDHNIEVRLPRFLTRSSYNIRFKNIKLKDSDDFLFSEIPKIVFKDFRPGKKSGFEFIGIVDRKYNATPVKAKIQIVGEVNFSESISFVFDSSNAEIALAENGEPIEVKLAGKALLNNWNSLTSTIELSTNDLIQGTLNSSITSDSYNIELSDAKISHQIFNILVADLFPANLNELKLPKSAWRGSFKLNKELEKSNAVISLIPEEDIVWEILGANYVAQTKFEVNSGLTKLELKTIEGEVVELNSKTLPGKQFLSLVVKSIKSNEKLNPWVEVYTSKALQTYLANNVISSDFELTIDETDLVSSEKKLSLKISKMINGKRAIEAVVKKGSKKSCELKSFAADNTATPILFNLNAKNCNFTTLSKHLDVWGFFPAGNYVGNINFEFDISSESLNFTDGKMNVFSESNALYGFDLARALFTTSPKVFVANWMFNARKSNTQLVFKTKNLNLICNTSLNFSSSKDLIIPITCGDKLIKIKKDANNYQIN